MKAEDIGIGEFYMGEDPNSLPKMEKIDSDIPKGYKPIDQKFLKLLPPFYLEKNKFYIGPNGDIKSELVLSHKFLINFMKFYHLKTLPSRAEMLFLIEHEFEKVFKHIN